MTLDSLVTFLGLLRLYSRTNVPSTWDLNRIYFSIGLFSAMAKVDKANYSHLQMWTFLFQSAIGKLFLSELSSPLRYRFVKKKVHIAKNPTDVSNLQMAIFAISTFAKLEKKIMSA